MGRAADYGPLADLTPIEWLLVATESQVVVQSLLMATHRELVAAGEPLPKLQAPAPPGTESPARLDPARGR